MIQREKHSKENSRQIWVDALDLVVANIDALDLIAANVDALTQNFDTMNVNVVGDSTV